MEKNENSQVAHDKKSCVFGSMQKDSSCLEEQQLANSDKDMELFLKLHIANHKPG